MTPIEDTKHVIAISQDDIRVVAGEIHFDQLPALKESVDRFVEKMQTVEVNEDNMKQSKKLIAATRKELDFLNEERKRVEKFYLAPLEAFKKEIKDISTSVTSAEDYVRDQVRNLEQQARDEKENEIHSIFKRHAENYELFDVLGFSDFFKPQYSNKTYSLNKVEEEIVAWLIKVENDLKFLSTQEDSEKLVAEYKDTKDVTLAIQNVQRTRDYYLELERKMAEKEQIEAKNEAYRKTQQLYSFEIEGSDQADTVENLLIQYHIPYKRRVK